MGSVFSGVNVGVCVGGGYGAGDECKVLGEHQG